MNLSVFSIPREKSTRGAGPQKEVDFLAHPPLQAQAEVVALVVALRFIAGVEERCGLP